MPRKNNSLSTGIPTALVAVAVLLLVVPTTPAQLTDLGAEPKEDPVFDTPGFQNFCVNDPCPGQTCDEVNDTCVGNVTLQPKMGAPLVGLSASQLDRFEQGKVEFDRTLTAAEGLGPVFNQNSCGSCHTNPLGGSGTITVTRFGEITVVGSDLIFDPLEQFGGSLLNKESISPDATRIGRFGWKLQLGTVKSFTADAMLQEMGFTNKIIPEDNAPNNDPVLLAACDSVADPEDVPNANGDDFLDLTTDFQRFLAPPPQTPRSGMTGEALFEAVGCADCHMKGFTAVSDDEDSDALSGTVNAYSDFLLHDMGFNGDFIEQGQAGLTELRTVPLWGLRVRDPMWHDGRVAGGHFPFRIQNAVFNHDADGSEAQASAQAYFALPQEEQDEIIRFLDSLGKREFDMDGDGFVDEADVVLIDDCALQGGPFTADDYCAVADADQSGFVDAADLELLDVVLGILNGDDEDEDSDDETGDDGNGDIVLVELPESSVADDSGIGAVEADPVQASGTAGAVEQPVAEDERERRADTRRRVSRRGL
jgi:mono/diheme cytochrome c family protein